MTVTPIKPQDEEIHSFGQDEHWQESWYFNWADPAQELFGLTRIGFRFHQNQIDGLILSIRRGKPEYAYPAVNVRYQGSWSDNSAAQGIRARGLLFTVEEPLKRWRLTLEGRDTMDLEWTAFTPAFNYHDSGGELPPNVASHHFEQSGRVTGWTRFKGQPVKINGTGQRDKSWGVRDWANVEGWNWISAQFGQDLTFNVWEGFFQGQRYQNGFLFHDGTNYPIEELTISFKWHGQSHVPLRSDIYISCNAGLSLEVMAQALGQFPMVRKGLLIQETHARFRATSNSKTRNGIGVIEHAWRPGKAGVVSRIPNFVATMMRAMW